MRAEEILREPLKLEREIVTLYAEIERIRMGLTPGGVDYASDRVQTSGIYDKYPAAMDRILAKEKKIGELNARRQWLINVRIPQLMAGIEDELAALIIRNYYFTDATMWEVAEMMHVSYATCYRYRYMGERDMQKVLDAES